MTCFKNVQINARPLILKPLLNCTPIFTKSFLINNDSFIFVRLFIFIALDFLNFFICIKGYRTHLFQKDIAIFIWQSWSTSKWKSVNLCSKNKIPQRSLTTAKTPIFTTTIFSISYRWLVSQSDLDPSGDFPTLYIKMVEVFSSFRTLLHFLFWVFPCFIWKPPSDKCTGPACLLSLPKLTKDWNT